MGKEPCLTLVTTVSWGMLIGDDDGKYVEGLIEKEKQHVAQRLAEIGFIVVSQYFEHECEWGRLVTRAALANKNTTYGDFTDNVYKYNDFYEPKYKELADSKYLDVTKVKALPIQKR